MTNLIRKRSRRSFITGKNAALDRIVTKSPKSFVDDLRVGDTIEPAVIRISDDDAWALYIGNEWIFSVVNREVSDITKAEPHVRPIDKSAKVDKNMQQRIDKVRRFLDNPNDNKESFKEIREKVVRDMLVFGKGTLEKTLDERRHIREVYSQDPRGIKIATDVNGKIRESDAYILKDKRGRGEIKWDIDEMIFMVLNPSSSSFYGVKTLDAIANSVAADILRSTYNARFFINGAEAAGIISLDGMSKKEVDKFKAQWKKNFQGVTRSHKLAVTNVPTKFVRMALTNRDMQFSEYGSELRMKIFSAYAMQPFIMGVIDANTGKLNSEQQVENYKDGALRPILSKESYYYTQEIVKMGFGYKDIAIEFPTLDLADLKTQSEIDRQDVTSGIVVINEVRARRNLSKVPWGDTPVSIIPGGQQVDPSGRSRSPRASAKPKKSLLHIFKNFVTPRIEAIDTHRDYLKFNKDWKMNEFIKTKKIFVNSDVYEVNFYQLPVELKRSEAYGVIEKMFTIDAFMKNNDPRIIYFQALISRIKYLIFENLLTKNQNNIYDEIDKIFYEEENSAFALEVL